MTKKEAKSFRNFGWREKDIYGRYIFENFEQIVYQFVKWLDNMITFAKQQYGKRAQFVIHDFNLGKHSDNSYHYKGLAVDGHFVGLTPVEAYMVISKFRFTAVGYYPEWSHPGWHIDKRPQLVMSQWVAYYDVTGKQVYDYNFKHFIDAIYSIDK